jgi:hypothetical protein
MTTSNRMKSTMVVAALAIFAVLGTFPQTSSFASQVTTVQGRYRIVSTDCYFSRGSCHVIFNIEQVGTRLSDDADKLFHGRVHGVHVRVGERYPQGTSEDSWLAVGTTDDGGRVVKGTMTDGIGGSGTFTMTKVGGR